MSHEELPLSLEAYERACVERAMREHGGTVRAAKALGIGKSTMYRKLIKLGICKAKPRVSDVTIVPRLHEDRAPVKEIPRPPKSEGPF